MRELMGSAYYGDELAAISRGTRQMEAVLRSALPETRDWETVSAAVAQHFGSVIPGVFGSQITAGDGWFIGAFMAAFRPAAMIEIGVASGYSSALILSLAKALGLLADGIYLHSFDLMETHANGCITGSLLREQFPEHVAHWSLTTQATTATLDAAALAAKLPDGTALAFIDGGHNHPWPVVDLTFLRRIPQCEWALLQDVQMMERWVADAVIYGAPVPAPIRGVQIAANHWPGEKIVGLDMCYNMAAVNLKISDEQERSFLVATRGYQMEMLPPDQVEACASYLSRIGA